MRSKATRRAAHAVVRVRRLLIEIFRTEPGPANSMKLPPLIAFIAMIAGWAVVTGLVWLVWLVIGLH